MKLEEWQSLSVNQKPSWIQASSQGIKLDAQDVKHALLNNQLQPHFQAHFDAQSGEIVGAEALVRWEHPLYGSLTPNHFLPLLIEQDLSGTLALNMIRSSVRHASKWHKAGRSIKVSVNVLPSDIAQPNFADHVLTILDEAQFSPNYLTLEITEEEITTDLTNTIANTARLRIRGVSISIDDFGTGHSSLSQLIHSPFNELKIDRSFVNKMSSSPKHLAVLKSIIDLSHSIGLNIVAEGVETREEAKFLSELGCQTLQGYYFNKPQAINEFNQLLIHSQTKVNQLTY
ncbi:EAL domain-containing protein [Vibrio mexicanus]|uniref:EAL domain-containing protein n=1 Tax=Vibrio mexicanus TaxID=1004326 RepID=UPI00063CE464|nr:EAL domain-containing protein [Vibrio mexicanus]